jgi:uncharacterized HAD superfamily protein
MPGAQEAIHTLARDYELIIATSRPSGLEEVTRKALKRHFPNARFAGFYFTTGQVVSENDRTKGGVCADHNASYFIDDAGHHAESCLSESPKTTPILLDSPWNVSYAHPQVIRAASWEHIVAEIAARSSRSG